MSSEEGFFDLLYLGIFVILSPAFDTQFYRCENPPPILVDEVAHAVHHFQSLLRVFSLRFRITLGGEVVSHKYVVDRMLAEFTAASMVFAKALQEDDEVGEGITFSEFSESIKRILQDSHPQAFPYYSRCLDSGHKQFVWTGPPLCIYPRTEEFDCLIPLITKDEMLDLPFHAIYTIEEDAAEPASKAQPTDARQVGKRNERGDDLDLDVTDEQPKKRKR